jgi:hypothetical protein
MEEFKVSETMKVLFSEEKRIDYICFKIGDKTYSTSFEEIIKGLIKGNFQIVQTKGIGEQSQIWIKGKFTEESNHKKLDLDLPFELNIYFHSL